MNIKISVLNCVIDISFCKDSGSPTATTEGVRKSVYFGKVTIGDSIHLKMAGSIGKRWLQGMGVECGTTIIY